MGAGHSAEHVDSFAKLPEDELWLRTGEFYVRGDQNSEWKKLEY
jgi:hypothetical protein